jgi:hypothetical protein
VFLLFGNAAPHQTTNNTQSFTPLIEIPKNIWIRSCPPESG